MLVIWPPILGLLGGLAYAVVFRDDITLFIRLGFGLGLGLGVVLAFALLFYSSFLVPPAQPAQTLYAIGEVERIRIVPYRGTARLVDGVPEQDLSAFIDGLAIKGHTSRAWIGYSMPSGALVDAEYWMLLCKPLRKIGVIEAVSPRKKGRLTTTDAAYIKSLLGLKNPT